MANRERLDRMNLFEAVVIGIYGNWLISFIDKISFIRDPVVYGVRFWGYQVWAVALSFFCLIFLFVFSVFRPRDVTRRLAFIIGVGHPIGNSAALWAEGWTTHLYVFFWIGVFLFFIIYAIELARIRIERINRG